LVLGSFTGLRIGIATVKAFSDSLAIPCIGISSLESLAYNVKESLENSGNLNNNTNLKNPEVICSILDCKNNNCYFALYELKNGLLEALIEPQSETIDATLAILKTYLEDNFDSFTITFVGNGLDVYHLQIKKVFDSSKFITPELNVLNSYNLALAGLDKYNSGIELQEILPLYLKKPQAQRQLEERQKLLNLKGL
jgi:tRNA threonylcarbamoyladenosine biosynthesis protein TsaB